jgi:outer membrane receptor protein involved in Fe transport
MTFVRRAVLGAMCLLLATAAFAQVTTADILGRVTDSSGAVLPGATITIVNTATGDTRTLTSTDTGDYVFNLLPIGSYTVTIELQGFSPQKTMVTVSSGDRARVDAKLALGTVSENIQVTAEAAPLQTDASTVGTLINEKAVQDLPVAGRNIMRLVQMIPGANEGAVSSTANGTRPDDRRQTSAVSVNGTADTQNNQLIDGLDNNERAIGTVGVKPSIDAIAEVKVQTNLYSADVGRTQGGVINILTKAGTNQFHGTVYEFGRSDKFDSADFFSKTRPVLKQNQFGGSVGGPVKTDKTFFFVDYEGFRNRQGVANIITVPTARMRAGDFGELSTPIFDPTLSPRPAFAGNVIPGTRIDPIAARLVALYPLPNLPGLSNNFASTTTRTQNMDTADFRVDHRFNGNNSLFARYSYNRVNTFTPGACPIVNGIDPNCIVGGIAAGGAFPGPNHTTASNIVGSYVKVFNPTLIGEFKGSYNHPDINSLPANYQKNLGTQFGIPNTNVDDLTSGMPLMSTTGYALIGDAQAVPLSTRDKTKQYAAAITKTIAAHNIKMGGGVVMRQFSVLQSISPVGVFTFDSLLTNNGAGQGGNTIASFLLGYPSTVVRALNPFDPKYHTNEPAVYAQDDWRALSWLTLNLGLRYDIFTPFTEEGNHLANFNPATKTMLVAGANGVSKAAGVKTDYTDVAPRLGFAATVTPQTVVRGGYGITYFPGNTASTSYLKNPPFTANYGPIQSTGSSGLVPNVRLADGLPPVATNDLSNLSGALIATALDFKANRVHQFNLMLERQLGDNVVSVGYVGQRGHRMAINPQINFAPAAAGAIQGRRVFASTYPNVSNIQLWTNQGRTKYDALQLIFQRRYSHGLTFNTHYTLAHAQQYTFAPWSGYEFEWSDAALDVRNRWVLTANYELPWGKSLKGLAGGVLGGWQVNSVAFWQGGFPFTVTNAAARMNTGGSDRPDMTCDPKLPKDERTLQKWFRTECFVGQAQFTAGSTPGTVLHGPANRRLDLSFFKDFSVSSEKKLQFRAEVYNLTNTPSFVNPTSALGNPAFGSISSTGNSIPRQMQFAVKYIF